MTLNTASVVSEIEGLLSDEMRITYWSDTANVPCVMTHVKEPSLSSFGASTLNVPLGPVVEYSILTLPPNPSERQRISYEVFCGRRSPPLRLVTSPYWATLLDASGVLPYAPRLT